MRIAILMSALLAMVAGLAHADTRAYEKEQLARFQKYAGQPVDEFPMFDLWQWQVVGPEKLVLWSTINTAYLVTVAKPCVNLEWTNGISVTQEMRAKVSAKFDFVNFAQQRCKISELRPIDYKAMVKAGDAKEVAKRTSPPASET